MILPLADIGAVALYMLFLWLLSCIAASWLAVNSGYSERAGLGSGMLLTILGAIIWVVIYLFFARPGSPRAQHGVIPRRTRSTAES